MTGGSAPTEAPVGYAGIASISGPLLVVRDVRGVGLGRVRHGRGGRRAERHALVLEVDGDLAVVQVLEGTGGLAPDARGGAVQRAADARAGRARAGWVGSATGAVSRSTAGRR